MQGGSGRRIRQVVQDPDEENGVEPLRRLQVLYTLGRKKRAMTMSLLGCFAIGFVGLCTQIVHIVRKKMEDICGTTSYVQNTLAGSWTQYIANEASPDPIRAHGALDPGVSFRPLCRSFCKKSQ